MKQEGRQRSLSQENLQGVLSHNLEGGGKTAAEWAQELAKEAGEVEGWVSLRVIKVLEQGKTKMGAIVSLDEGEVGGYLLSTGRSYSVPLGCRK